MKTTILVDDREPESVVKAIKDETDAEIIVTRLDVGDCIVGNVIIERKTANDFLGSVRSKRIFDQSNELRKHEDCIPIIIVVGDMKEALIYHKYPKRLLCAVNGALASLCVRFGISVIMAGGEWSYAYIISRIASQMTKTTTRPIKRKGKDRTLQEIAEDMLCQIPNVGRERAKVILKTTKSLSKLSRLSAKEIAKIPGVGKKTAETIVKVYRETPHKGDGKK